MIINGLLDNSLNANDRSLLYGDGVFRTLLVQQGKPLHWTQHYNKLQHDCVSLGITCPTMQTLQDELAQLTFSCAEGVAKIIITRGSGSRGYKPDINAVASRILSLSSIPKYPEDYRSNGIKLHLCTMRLAHQPRLAGIKHLNRLENVLAAAEWNDPAIPEGLMLDQNNLVIEGTRSNLFMLRNGILSTPDLSRCGVAGLQRDRVMELAAKHGLACTITDITMTDLQAADEIFIVNSVIGLWPIRELSGYHCKQFAVSLQIQEWLNTSYDQAAA
jgi:4-amino-4-deoxychorismate lyase